jgi:RecA/RadA recombinase
MRMPVTPEAYEEFIAWRTKEYGENEILEFLREPTPRIPFVSPTLTWATTGGVPLGHLCRWYGPEGSGKSMTNWGLTYVAHNFPRIISERYEIEIHWLEQRRKKFQAIKRKKQMNTLLERFPEGLSVYIFDAEGRIDLNLAAQLGIDVNDSRKLYIDPENIIENVLDIAAGAMEAYNIIIIDSGSACESLAEAGLKPGEELRASAPRAWSRLKQTNRRKDRRENIMIVVDQMRTQLGQTNHKGQASVTPPGVRILRHQASVAIEYKGGKKLYLNDSNLLTDDYDKASAHYSALGTDGKETHGIEMRCKVAKNSSGRPDRNARMRFRFPVHDIRTGELVQGVGFDEDFELLAAGEHFELIENGGAGNFYLLDDKFERQKKVKNGPPVHWRGEWNVRKAISEDPELRERILGRLYADI